MLFLVGLLGLMAIGLIGFSVSRLGKAESQDIDPPGDNTDVETHPAPDAPADTEAEIALADSQSNEEIEGPDNNNSTFLANLTDLISSDAPTSSVDISDWNIDGQVAKKMDYDNDLDSLILIWDEDAEQDPDVKVIKDAENPDLAHVMLNGRILADINGGGDLSASDIVLVPKSTALAASANPTIAALFNAA